MRKKRESAGIPPGKLLVLQVILVLVTLGALVALLAATGVLFD